VANGADTTIIIETENYFISLGANELGGWFEKIERKKKI